MPRHQSLPQPLQFHCNVDSILRSVRVSELVKHLQRLLHVRLMYWLAHVRLMYWLAHVRLMHWLAHVLIGSCEAHALIGSCIDCEANTCIDTANVRTYVCQWYFPTTRAHCWALYPTQVYVIFKQFHWYPLPNGCGERFNYGAYYWYVTAYLQDIFSAW